jgi:polysaccharide pyruvyl transferase WcaK-like protein
MNISLQRQMQVQNDIWQIIELLKQDGHDDIRLLCHDHRDIPFAASFNQIPYVYISDPYGYLALLKNCKLNVTYRVHSALPCMAFETPFIKLSYDERSISLMKTLGFDDWNIDIVKADNIINSFSDRLSNLDKLETTYQSAQPIWDRIRKTQDSAMGSFSSDVRRYFENSSKK